MSEGLVTWSCPQNDVNLRWEAGWQNVDEFEHEIDLTLEHYYNPNLTSYIGGRATNDSDASHHGIVGLNYRLPGLFMSKLNIDSDAALRLTIDKELQLTDRLGWFGEIDYDTDTQFEGSSGFTYTLNKAFSLIAQYHSEYGLGAGVDARF